MSSARHKLIAILIPLLLAAGLFWALPRLRFLAAFEHEIFPAAERFSDDDLLLTPGPLKDFELTVQRFSPGDDEPANIGTYRFDDETHEIMGPGGGSPVEWAQFLRQTRLPDDRLTVVTSSLSWPDATELSLRALQEQINQTPRFVIGLQAELLNRPSSLPRELSNSIIPGPLPDNITPPEIDHLSAPPSIIAPMFGISGVRGLKIEEKDGSLRLPLIVRWGESLLPTLPLAALLTANDLTVADVLLDPNGFIHLGRSGPVLRLDSEGFTWLDDSPVEVQSASQLQIYPEQAETFKIIRPEEPPRQSEHLASQLRQALAQEPQTVKRYQRWPLALEIAFLILPALLLATSRPWLAIPFLFLGPVLAPWFSRWLPFSPFLVLALAALFLRKLLPEGETRPQKKQKKKRYSRNHS